MGSLKGKTLFITGASRGIGLAIALRAARDGANVVVAAKTAVSAPMTGLSPGAVYHYRLGASNSLGTNFTADATFTTAPAAPITAIWLPGHATHKSLPSVRESMTMYAPP